MSLAIIKQKEPAVYAIHTELRKDLQRFLSVGNRWNTLDEKKFKALQSYWNVHVHFLHQHHDAEDKHFFPVYRQKGSDVAKLIDELETQHHVLIQKIELLNAAFEKREKAKLETLFTEYAAFVEKHLSEEESAMVKIFEFFTQEEINALGDAYAKKSPKKDLIGKLPWILDGMDAEMRQQFFTKVPFFVPVLYKVLKKKFDKQVAVFDQL